jgi:hypothetical protein
VAGVPAAALSFDAVGGAAAADPTAMSLELVSDNGKTYSVTVNIGSGALTPAFDAESNSVLVPVTFGAFSGTLFDDQETRSSLHRAGGDQGRLREEPQGPVTCSFTIDEVSDGSDPGFPERYRFVSGGTVVLKIVGR